MHPACPNKKQNHLQNSLLRRTQFWVRKTIKTSLVALCGHHKPQSFIEIKILRFWNPDTINTSKNELKHGPKNGTAWWSHFWDRMHSLAEEQKKSTFTVTFLEGGRDGSNGCVPSKQRTPAMTSFLMIGGVSNGYTPPRIC